MYRFSYDNNIMEIPYKTDTIGNPYINHPRASQALHTRVATCHAHIGVPHVCHTRAHHAPRLAPHGPTVELSGRKLAHGAPRGARARDFVNFREKKQIYASRARRARAGLTVYPPKSSKKGRCPLSFSYDSAQGLL
jgi:hypothetical protein